MTRNQKQYEIVLGWRKQLKAWGDYDNSLGGVIAELYAVEKYGMQKEVAGNKAIDGYINGRRVQVKAKDSRKVYKNPDTQHYAQIKAVHRKEIDDILLIFINDEGVYEEYLFDVNEVKPMKVNDGKSLRYILKNIKAYCKLKSNCNCAKGSDVSDEESGDEL